MNSSSQIQRSQAPGTADVESVESSIESLLKMWQRRERWRLFFVNLREEDESGRATWRIKLAHFLESTSVRFFTVGLLITDLVLTVFALSSSLVLCSSRKQESTSKAFAYHWAGVALLSLLFTRTLALMVALGASFLRRPGCIVDGAVVAAALALEAFVGRDGGGLVVVASLWRVVRVVESAFELSDEAIELQIERVVCQLEALREENRRLWERVGEGEDVIEKLREELDRCCRCEKTTMSL